jgi:hypothetical protein
MHRGDEEAGLDMLLGLFLQELPQHIFNKVTKVPELRVAFEESFDLFEDFAIYADASSDPYQAVLHPSFFMRNYYIAVSSCWRR